MAALLFARTRGSWAAGWKGGLSFGLFLGLVLFFQRFYDPLVIDGYPYYLSWCQGGISMIDSLLAGAVIGCRHQGVAARSLPRGRRPADDHPSGGGLDLQHPRRRVPPHRPALDRPGLPRARA